MSEVFRLFHPKTLTLITTHKCSSSCVSCCFDCSPRRVESMCFSDACAYIDSFIDKYPGLEIVILTGGEVMLMGLDWVCKVLSHIKSKGIKSRIVTNAFWAKTSDKAKDILTKLVNSGLNEINVSTGDEHLKFVPIESVLNVICESEKIEGIESSAVVIESGKDKRYTILDFRKDLVGRIDLDELRKLKVLESPWVNMTGKSIHFQDNDDIIDIPTNASLSRGCSSMFSGIQVNPNGQLLSCCGFASEYSPLLKIGNFKDIFDREGYLESIEINNVLKMWLFVDGPRGIFEYFNPGKSISGNIHDCEVCTRLVMNTDYLFKISRISSSKVKDIIYRAMFKFENQIS